MALTYEQLCDALLGIAQQEDLTYCETTTGMNGYPRELRPALYGFRDFDHYKEVRDKYDLEGVYLEWRDGQQLPNRTTNYVFEPFSLNEDDFGCDCLLWYKGDLDYFWDYLIQALSEYSILSDFGINVSNFKNFSQIQKWLDNDTNWEYDDKDLDEIQELIDKHQVVYNAIAKLKDDKHAVVTNCGYLYKENVQVEGVMTYASDTIHHAIGLM